MLQHGIELCKEELALKATTLTAGGTTSATGEIIDRFGVYTDPAGDYELNYDINTLMGISALDGAIADTETLSLKVYLQTSDDASFSTDVNYVDAEGEFSATAPSTGYAEYTFTGATATAVTFDDVLSLKAYLKSCKRYLRLFASATFSAGSVDNVVMTTIASLGDSQNNAISDVEIKDVVAE